MAPRIWFITGASSGFGLLMAKKALENGDKVVATLRQPEAISDFAAKYDKERLIVVRLDVTRREEIAAAFTAAKEAFGRIDIVFNNAGFGILGEIESTTEEVARSLFEVNFWGAMNVARQAVSFFREENTPSGGLLINMSSMFGIDAPPAAGFYAAALATLEAATDSLAKELDPAWNIKVVLVCPGWYKTELVYKVKPEDIHPAYVGKDALASIQMRKIAAELFTGRSPLLGDPAKLIDKFYELSKLENPPYRLAFGDDAKQCFQNKWTALKSDLESSEEWSKGLKFT
ncbi:NAD(P)-binding protein [Mycena rosella]|uniref:NAD(P)-binding protein n=1 Tax=Mycena rosella TaxID=1033263 RepID=A0AAD7DNV0_MYCRO|nr:NAD(P)-binding protein [Mycena rosella]